MSSSAFSTVFLWTVSLCQSEKHEVTKRFELIKGSTLFDGLGCAASMYDSWRGAQFESASGTCSPFTKDWKANTSMKFGYNFWQLTTVEYRMREKYLKKRVPANFRHGDSIVLFYEKEAYAGGALTVRVNLFDGDAVIGRFGPEDHIYFHISNDKHRGFLLLNSFENGAWGSEQLMRDPFQGSTGKLEIVVQRNTVLVYVNDDIIFKYVTLLPISEHLVLQSYYHDTVCNGMHIIYRK